MGVPTWENAILLVGAFVGAGLSLTAFRLCRPSVTFPAVGPNGGGAADQFGVKLVEWERDRVLGAAKGLATGSSGFLVALLTAVIKDEVSEIVTPLLVLVGCVCGSMGLLLLAAKLSRESARFTLGHHPAAGSP